MRLDHLLSKREMRKSRRQAQACSRIRVVKVIPLFSYKGSQGGSGEQSNEEFLVAMRPGDTPVPIPNTMVKARTADGTLLETARESRWLPE